jgi:6-pyruvoyltetrahydropterin/6-carboxytetrahydropterin synthase
MITVTKKFSFCYGHQLPNYIGKCKNVHGHNSEVEVEVTGPIVGIPGSRYPGMVIDFGELKERVNHLLEQFDHQFLNTAIPEIDPPTAENIVSYMAAEIEKRMPPNVTLLRVRVTETSTSWAEWKA